MDISIIQIILLFGVAFLAGIESVVDEWQFHQPLVACTLIGFVMGDLKTGIILGGTLQLISLGWMNIGAAIAPDAALASVISAILVIIGKQDIKTGIALAIPVAIAGQVLTIFVRTLTVAIQHMADKSVQDGNLDRLTRLHLCGLVLQGLRIAIPALIVAFAVNTDGVRNLLGMIPEWVQNGLKVGGGIIVAVGYAMIINMMRAPGLMMFFAVGFVTAAFLPFNLIGFGMIGFAIAYFYLQLHPKYYQQTSASYSAPVKNPLDNQLD